MCAYIKKNSTKVTHEAVICRNSALTRLGNGGNPKFAIFSRRSLLIASRLHCVGRNVRRENKTMAKKNFRNESRFRVLECDRYRRCAKTIVAIVGVWTFDTFGGRKSFVGIFAENFLSFPGKSGDGFRFFRSSYESVDATFLIFVSLCVLALTSFDVYVK